MSGISGVPGPWRACSAQWPAQRGPRCLVWTLQGEATTVDGYLTNVQQEGRVPASGWEASTGFFKQQSVIWESVFAQERRRAGLYVKDTQNDPGRQERQWSFKWIASLPVSTSHCLTMYFREGQSRVWTVTFDYYQLHFFRGTVGTLITWTPDATFFWAAWCLTFYLLPRQKSALQKTPWSICHFSGPNPFCLPTVKKTK